MDQYLNLKLDNITTLDEANYPHLSAVRNIFIRGSVVRYVHLPANAIDTALLEDAARRGKFLWCRVFQTAANLMSLEALAQTGKAISGH